MTVSPSGSLWSLTPSSTYPAYCRPFNDQIIANRERRGKISPINSDNRRPTMPFYLTPEQDNSNQELQICIAEALYDVDSIVADPGLKQTE